MENSKDIKHVWSIICESSIVDQQSNNISIHKVLEQLQVDLTSNKPLTEKEKTGIRKAQIPFPFQVVSMWQSINPKKIPVADVEIELLDPIGESLQKTIFQLKFQKDKARMRTIISNSTIALTDTGLYIFKVGLKEEKEDSFTLVAEIPLEVKVNKVIKK
ncbi:MAG: hypothetical protein M3M85_00820 [bacterium]|nr:hypothetical protein [bacterium]